MSGRRDMVGGKGWGKGGREDNGGRGGERRERGEGGALVCVKKEGRVRRNAEREERERAAGTHRCDQHWTPERKS
jgi:hypothetical protein